MDFVGSHLLERPMLRKLLVVAARSPGSRVIVRCVGSRFGRRGLVTVGQLASSGEPGRWGRASVEAGGARFALWTVTRSRVE